MAETANHDERAGDMVLIGGLWLDPSAWDDVVPHLRALGVRPTVVALPGQGDGNRSADLADQIEAVLAAVDAAPTPPVVVGHSAAASLAWIAADRRPDTVAGVVLVGGFPNADGEAYADFFEPTDGVMPFPGWEPFAGPDSDDLDEATRTAIADAAVPVPVGVSRGVVRLSDPRRYEVPVALVCPEFSPEEAREWIAGGDLPELAAARRVSLVNLDSGHWPMFSRPEPFARALADIARGGLGGPPA